MPYDVYDGNGNKILQDQPSTFTVTNLSPLKTYSNYKVVDTVTGKSIVLKPLQTSSKPATDVTTSQPILNLDVHNNPQMQISVQVSPQDTTDTTSFTTSDATVATVSGSGLVSAVGNGSTYVTVLVGSQTASVQINVTGG
ncbi:MAG: hypothetical protein [Caudoviricetes sp.]|nr:MAG: hypothetical protein [Caudoviricetes sp.]